MLAEESDKSEDGERILFGPSGRRLSHELSSEQNSIKTDSIKQDLISSSEWFNLNNLRETNRKLITTSIDIVPDAYEAASVYSCNLSDLETNNIELDELRSLQSQQPSVEYRRLILDDYVKYQICENQTECSCHFKHDNADNTIDLLNSELEKYYRENYNDSDSTKDFETKYSKNSEHQDRRFLLSRSISNLDILPVSDSTSSESDLHKIYSPISANQKADNFSTQQELVDTWITCDLFIANQRSEEVHEELQRVPCELTPSSLSYNSNPFDESLEDQQTKSSSILSKKSYSKKSRRVSRLTGDPNVNVKSSSQNPIASVWQSVTKDEPCNSNQITTFSAGETSQARLNESEICRITNKNLGFTTDWTQISPNNSTDGSSNSYGEVPRDSGNALVSSAESPVDSQQDEHENPSRLNQEIQNSANILSCSLTDNNSTLSLSWSYESLLKFQHKSCSFNSLASDSNSEEDLEEFIENCIAKHRASDLDSEVLPGAESLRVDPAYSPCGKARHNQHNCSFNNQGNFGQSSYPLRPRTGDSFLIESISHQSGERSSRELSEENENHKRINLISSAYSSYSCDSELLNSSRSSSENKVNTNPSTYVTADCKLQHDNNNNVKNIGDSLNFNACRRTHRDSLPRALSDETLSHPLLAANYEPTKRLGVRDGGSRPNSMRALKDIAKVSIPSLSTLQYLPVHSADLPGKRGRRKPKQSLTAKRIALNEDPKLQHMPRRHSIATLTTTRTSNMKASSDNGKKANSTNRIMQHSESIENVHDDSCLFHKLCLCTCTAKNNQNDKVQHQDDLGKDKSTSKKTYSKGFTGLKSTDKNKETSDAMASTELNSDSTSGKTKKSKTKNTSSSVTSKDESESSSSRDKTSLNAKIRDLKVKTSRGSRNSKISTDAQKSLDDNEFACQPSAEDLSDSSKSAQLDRHSEKQSPKFLSIFTSSSRENQHLASLRDDFCGKIVGTRRKWDQPPELPDAERAILPHSEDPKSQRTPSVSQSKSKLDVKSESNLSTKVDTNIDDLAKSDCQTSRSSSPNIKQTEPKGRTSPYKRLLSPAAKLFGSYNQAAETKSKSIQKNQDLRADIDTVVNFREKSNEGHDFSGHKESLFSRSLNRISGRKSKSQIKRSSNKSRTKLDSQGNCASSSTSRSSSSYTNQDHPLMNNDNQSPLKRESGSDRSERSAFKSLISPGIVVNSVEYLHDGRLSKSPDLSLQEEESHFMRSVALSGGSETMMSDLGLIYNKDSEFGSDLLHNSRAFSLPSSPRVNRRNNFSDNQQNSIHRRSPRLSKSPIPFKSPASESSRIEDGLSVCSIEHFEKHIGNIKGNQIEAQKRLFKAWINHFSPNLIRNDLIEELRDGIKLIGLLAAITNDRELLAQYERLNKDKQSYINRLIITPSSRLRHLSNVSISIKYLRDKCGMRLVNLNPMDIVSGKPNVILGLCWNLILNFQLEHNFPRHDKSANESSGQINELDKTLDTSSSDICSKKSQFPTKNYTESSVKKANKEHIFKQRSSIGIGQIEEYTQRDIIDAKNKLFDHINRRFNLKLTHLTSNLLDGDVLLLILKQLSPKINELFTSNPAQGKLWNSMDQDEKLDHCFELSSIHLDIPKLFSACDLKQQSIDDNISKPLLVYLSMLLDCPASQIDTKTQILDLNDQENQHDYIRVLFDMINTEDRFELDKIQSTLIQVEQLTKLIQSERDLDQELVDRIKQLDADAKLVDDLISWINEADRLLESQQKSPAELKLVIETYEKFFSETPKISANISATLERQFRECLSTARQRIHMMEQTLKNWDSYEESRKELKEWLSNAESKLTEALKPMCQHQFSDDLNSRPSPIEVHTNCLDDLIDYFELECLDDSPESESGKLFGRSHLSISLGSIDENTSISGSMISIGSSLSRQSTLTSSKNATYYRLFDDFELKCRLLAAMLEADQRDALLLGVRELKYRLRYITEQRVPQVLNELRFNISRYEMSIQEQDEISEYPSSGINESDSIAEESEPIKPHEDSTTTKSESEDIVIHDEKQTQEPGNVMQYTLNCIEPPSKVIKTNDLEREKLTTQPVEESESSQKHKNISAPKNNEKTIDQKIKHNVKSSDKSKTKSKQKSKKNPNNLKPKIASQADGSKLPIQPELCETWSICNWILPRSRMIQSQNRQEKSNAIKTELLSSKSKGSKKNVPKGKVSPSSRNESPDENDSRLAAFWRKIVRASRASFSLNMVLLICLAGICIVPLINRDACCELSEARVTSADFSVNERPT